MQLQCTSMALKAGPHQEMKYFDYALTSNMKTRQNNVVEGMFVQVTLISIKFILNQYWVNVNDDNSNSSDKDWTSLNQSLVRGSKNTENEKLVPRHVF